MTAWMMAKSQTTTVKTTVVTDSLSWAFRRLAISSRAAVNGPGLSLGVEADRVSAIIGLKE